MIRIRQLKVSVLKDNPEELKRKIKNKIGILVDDYIIVKKSIDARDKNNVFYVYEININTERESEILKKYNNKDIFLCDEESYKYEITGKKKNNKKIVIVGSGPSGLFCAYMLAEAGFPVLVLEQGEMMEERIKSVNTFFETNKLNPLSNIQFGEGGAGTFSDGKLNTLVKDKVNRGKKVFEIFVENGAPEEIMYLNKPHIGTDILRKVVVNMRKKILSMGGDFSFNSKVTDILIDNNRVCGVVVNNKDTILCDTLVLAIGHSAREMFYLLNDKGFSLRSKRFSVGFRVVHSQEMINKNQYGKFYKFLPPASYKLTHQCRNGRGVYSFCMCPGGFVVNASSEEGGLVVNGMSNYKRDEDTANSAIVVTIGPEDYGNDVLDGVVFQRELEKKAFELGNGFIPVQLYKDFCNNKVSEKYGSIVPKTMGQVSFSDLNKLFSSDICNSLKEGMEDFDKKIHGFADEDVVLLGVESRTSSPVIIERNEEGLSNIMGVYPCGEGAGYAGGITTAAIDGIKVFENIIKKYYP